MSLQSRLASGDVYYGWIVTVVCFLMTASIFSVTYSFGVVFEPILEQFERSRADTSLLFSVQTLTLYVSGAVFGGIIDKYGRRRLLLVGTALFGTGLFVTTRAHTFFQVLLTYGVLTGVGMGIVYVIAYSTIPEWFYRRRGLASGIGTSGTGVGIFLFPPVVAFLISLFGWQQAYFLATFVLVGLLLVSVVLIADRPQDLDVDPTGEIPSEHREESRTPGRAEQVEAILTKIRSGTFRSLFIGILFVYIPAFLLFVHLVLYATDVDISRTVGVLAVSVIGGATLPGRLLIDHSGDRIGRSWMLIASTLLMGVSIILLPMLRLPVFLLGFAVVYGIAFGGSGTLIAPVLSDQFGTANINTLFGFVAVALGIAAVIGPYLAGAIYDVLGTYSPVFVGTGILGILGSAFIANATVWG